MMRSILFANRLLTALVKMANEWILTLGQEGNRAGTGSGTGLWLSRLPWMRVCAKESRVSISFLSIVMLCREPTTCLE